jgi:hypothetical protein
MYSTYGMASATLHSPRRDGDHSYSDHVAGPITHRISAFPDLKLQIAVVSSYLLSYHGMSLSYWYLPSPFSTFSYYVCLNFWPNFPGEPGPWHVNSSGLRLRI